MSADTEKYVLIKRKAQGWALVEPVKVYVNTEVPTRLGHEIILFAFDKGELDMNYSYLQCMGAIPIELAREMFPHMRDALGL